MLPRVLALVLALLFLAPAFAASAAEPTAPASPRPIRVAVIDTGIEPAHPEFAPGQVVAWWSFTSERKPAGVSNDPYTYPAASQSWDPHVEPFDLNGHGTATASLVAGLNVQNCGAGGPKAQKMSFAPGAELIIAKVSEETGGVAGGSSIAGDIALAIRWAVEQGADVISISIGSIAPVPIHFDDAAFRHARANNVLVVVSAGNGLGNTGLAPFPAWSSTYGNAPDALVVGSGDRAGNTRAVTTGNIDPDVSSWSESVCIARARGGYAQMSGTSFSAPLVAGMAAGAKGIGLANGRQPTAAYLETLVLYSATNNPQSPYAREGLGFVLDNEWPAMSAAAASGTYPNYHAQGLHTNVDVIYRNWVVRLGGQGILV